MKPFILIQSRPEDDASDDEYRAFLRYTGLPESRLQRIRLEQSELPAIGLDQVAGIFVGGGPFNYTDPNKSNTQLRVESEMGDLLSRIIEDDFPFLGACYGIGLIVPQLGGTVSRSYGEPVGAVKIEIVDRDPLLEGLPDHFDAFLGHKEGCEILPAQATLLARSANCPVQMLKVGKNVYATQFHPELDSDGLAVRINIYKDHGYFNPEQADALIDLGYEATVDQPMKILRNFVRLYG